MTDKRDASDACPFPPDKSPPPKTTATNVLDYADRFFEGWRNTMLTITIASLLLAYSLVAAIPPIVASVTVPQSWSRLPSPA